VSKKRYNKNNIKRMKAKIRGSSLLPPRNRSRRPMTDLEQMVADLLDDLKIEFEREKPLKYLQGWRYFDFHLIEHGILIEVDGAYWHGDNPKPSYVAMMAKKNDMIKNWLAKKEGYKLVRIKEKQLKEDFSSVKNIISGEINKNLSRN